MAKRKINFVFLFTLIIFAASVIPVFAQAQRELQKTEQIEPNIEKEQALINKIEKKKPETDIEEQLPSVPTAPASEEKVMVKNITVTGITLITEAEANNIVNPFKNKEMNVRDMQQAAGLVTDAYRKKGFITSRAYIPPQKIEQGLLEIRVVEGVTGNIEVKGNRFYKTTLIRNKIDLVKGEPFNYNTLRQGLSAINQQPDRHAKAVITPGKEAGTTDTILNVEDHFPIHAGFTYDNFGSRYVKKDRYKLTLKDNNLLGWDDILTTEWQKSEKEYYSFLSFRYLLPLMEGLKVGLYANKSRLTLGREYTDLNVRGKSKLYSFYLIKSLMDTDNLDINLNAGFDYKDIYNFQLDEMQSRDRERIAKLGFDADMTDKFGRTLLTYEIDCGIPNIMGGMKSHDEYASRDGSGGEFIKNIWNILRLQRLPFESTLLAKAQIQHTSYILTAAEQFQIGGIANVRGYPAAELVGDNGYAMTYEWSCPIYPLSKKIIIPFSKEKVYDRLRFVTFWDWANVVSRRTQPGERTTNTRSGVGFGIRFNLPQRLTFRVEAAWPLNAKPSDNSNCHVWNEVSVNF